MKAQADVEPAGGVPLISDANRQATLDQAGVSEETATAVLEVNQQARLDRLRAALVRLAGVALLVLLSALRIPNPWPPAGKYMVATGEHLVAAVTRERLRHLLQAGIAARAAL